MNAPREKLIEHLKNDDFFATDKYSESTFKVRSTDGNKVKGDLTIRGITNEEAVIDVKISETNGIYNAEGNLVFDRQKYDVANENLMKVMVL